jgi:hypothetical protein
LYRYLFSLGTILAPLSTPYTLSSWCSIFKERILKIPIFFSNEDFN